MLVGPARCSRPGRVTVGAPQRVGPCAGSRRPLRCLLPADVRRPHSQLLIMALRSCSVSSFVPRSAALLWVRSRITGCARSNGTPAAESRPSVPATWVRWAARACGPPPSRPVVQPRVWRYGRIDSRPSRVRAQNRPRPTTGSPNSRSWKDRRHTQPEPSTAAELSVSFSAHGWDRAGIVLARVARHHEAAAEPRTAVELCPRVEHRMREHLRAPCIRGTPHPALSPDATVNWLQVADGPSSPESR